MGEDIIKVLYHIFKELISLLIFEGQHDMIFPSQNAYFFDVTYSCVEIFHSIKLLEDIISQLLKPSVSRYLDLESFNEDVSRTVFIVIHDLALLRLR